MTLPACALFTPRQAEIELQLLPPADLEQEVLLKQKLTFVSDGREQRFLAVVRLERERVRMLVLTAAGRQLLALDYDGETLSQDNRSQQPIPGREMLASLQFSLWPSSSIRQRYRPENGWLVEIGDTQRSLLTSSGAVLIIRRNPEATILDNLVSRYRVRIETLERTDL